MFKYIFKYSLTHTYIYLYIYDNNFALVTELDDFSSQRPELASGQPTQSRPNVVDIALTVVPVTLVCILFALATIVIYLFRKKICSTKKKPSKEEMVSYVQ